MLTKRTGTIAIAVALGALLVAPLAGATTSPSVSRTDAQKEISSRLDRFEGDAAALQKQADNYAASVRTKKPQRLSHAHALNEAKIQVNDLGVQLSELEKLSPQGTDLQRMAITGARTHLQAVADHLQNAIVTLNEDKNSYLTPEFKEMVNDLYEHADNLYTNVDAITDYEKASDRASDLKPIAES
jgi:DNA repair ATPase RecN